MTSLPSLRRSVLLAAAAAFALPVLIAGPAKAQTEEIQPQWPGKGQLFVGANYQPVDRSPAQIRADIAIMKGAGFNLVRIGDLSWDSFEPEEGRFTFDLWDSVMAQLHAAGIKVVLDIPGQPAPLWLHRKYPGVNIIAQNGDRQQPASRYMDNTADPDYRRLLRRLADRILQRYGKHPAVIAVGYNNEIGNGRVSYGEPDRQRFIGWLQRKYGTLDVLNRAWAGQRWSRKISDWDEVQLPNIQGPGPNERYLDLRRFWSEDTIRVLEELEASRKANAPHLPSVSNYWPYASSKGFDWLKSWDRVSSYGAQGFYPGDPLNAAFEAMLNKGGHSTPLWFNEFTAGGGGYYGTPGRSRMWAYFGLLYQSQTFLAWTFNSHIGGEEQALFGLVDHDGRPSWKVEEWGRMAREMRMLEKLGFPYMPRVRVAIDYNFDTAWLTSPPDGPNTMKEYFKVNYWDQARAAFAPFYEDNVDAAVIDITHADLSQYRLIVLPAAYMMEPARRAALRRFVERGGIAVMTGYSSKVDETAKWFETPLPGGLTELFGVRTNAFYRAGAPLQFTLGGQQMTGSDPYFEVLEPQGAKVLARFENVAEKSPAVTVNQVGKGKAIYLAAAAQSEFLGPLVRSLYAEAGITRGPATPAGVVARVVEGRTLYVNTRGSPVSIPGVGQGTNRLTGKAVSGALVLSGFEAALIQ